MTTLLSSSKTLAEQSLLGGGQFGDDPLGHMNQTLLDAAVETNRQNTPAAVAEKRVAPRYSIGEINQLDWGDLADRFNRLPKADTRPAIVRFFDIVDLPRNAIANAITSVALPSARRAAIERGDVDDAGMPKVWGSDILRGMGFNNRVVTAIAGFGLDIVMDPISWALAPIGGLSAVGKTGARVSLGATGSKAWRQGLKAIGSGRGLEAVRSPQMRSLIQEASRVHNIPLDAGKEAAASLSKVLLGEPDKGLSALLERATFSRAGKEGELVKGTIERTGGQALELAVQGVDDPAYINAIKDFVGKYTLNRGARIAGGTAAYGHVPFTDFTLYGPRLGKMGKHAEMQLVFAAAREGNYDRSGVIRALSDARQEMSRLTETERFLTEQVKGAADRPVEHVVDAAVRDPETGEIFTGANHEVALRKAGAWGQGDNLAEKWRDASDNDIQGFITDRGRYLTRSEATTLAINSGQMVGDSESPMLIAERLDSFDSPHTIDKEAYQKAIGETRSKITELKTSVDAKVNEIIAGSENFEGVTPYTVGDLIATRMLRESLEADFKLAKTQQHWQEVSDEAFGTIRVPQATRSDLSEVMELQRTIAQEAGFDLAETAIDSLAPMDERLVAFSEIGQRAANNGITRHGEYIGLGERDMKLQSMLIDSLSDVANAAADVHFVSGLPMASALNSDQRQIALAAAALMGIDDRSMGVMRLASASRVLERLSETTGIQADSAVARLGDAATKMFGLAPDTPYARLVSKAMHDIRTGGIDAIRPLLNDLYAGGGMFVREGANGIAEPRGILQIIKDAGIPRTKLDEFEEFVVAVAQTEFDPQTAHWLKRVQDGEDSPLVRAIAKGRQYGWLDNKELMEDVSRLAGQTNEFWSDLGIYDFNTRVLNSLLPDPYYPLMLRKEYARFLQSIKSEALQKGGGAPTPLKGFTESYERPRDIREIRFSVPDAKTLADRGFKPKQIEEIQAFDKALGGGTHNYIELERDAWSGLPDAQIERWAQEGKDITHINEVRAKVKLFEMLYPDMKDHARALQFGRPLDPFEASERLKDGLFSGIASPKDARTIFETSLGRAMAMRGMGRAVREAKDTFLEQVVKPFVIPLDLGHSVEQAKTFERGAEITLGNGTTLQVVGRGEDNSLRLRLGDTIYRRLPSAASTGDQPAIDLTELWGSWAKDQNVAPFVPEPVYHAFKRFEEAMTHENFNTVMKALNRVTSAWRVFTLGHPSWGVVNSVGNTILYFMAHPDLLANPARAYEHLSAGVKIAAHRRAPAKLKEMTFEIGGRVWTGDEILRLTDAERVSNGGINYDLLRHLIQAFDPDQLRTVPGQRLVELLREFPDRTAKAFSDALTQDAILNQAAKSDSKLGANLRRLRAAAKAANETALRPAVDLWFRTNSAIDDSFRIASFLSYLEKGNDVGEAAAKTRNALLNFGDLTEYESKYLRSLMPFYSWLRASMPNMLSKLAQDPRYFTTVPKSLEAVEELTAGEDALPRHMRPRWIQEQLGIQIGANPDARKFVTIGTMLPQEQAYQTVTGLGGIPGHVVESTTGLDMPFDGQSFMDYLDFVSSQQAPWLRAMTDLARQEEGFTRRTIGKSLEEGDISINEYLLGQVRQLRELGVGSVRRGALQRSFDEGLVPGVSRLAIGGRLQPGDESRRLYYVRRDMRQKEERIRRAIRLAEREQNQGASLNARAELLLLYRGYLDDGGDIKDVPVWARDQLTMLSAAGPDNAP